MIECERQFVRNGTDHNSILTRAHLARIGKLLRRGPDNLTVSAKTVWGGCSLYGDEASSWECNSMTRESTVCLVDFAKLWYALERRRGGSQAICGKRVAKGADGMNQRPFRHM